MCVFADRDLPKSSLCIGSASQFVYDALIYPNAIALHVCRASRPLPLLPTATFPCLLTTTKQSQREMHFFLFLKSPSLQRTRPISNRFQSNSNRRGDTQ